MPDVFTKAKRSAVMSRIRGAGNKDTELRLIILMRAAGITGWRRGARLRFAARDQKSDVRGQKANDRGQMPDFGGHKKARIGSPALFAISAVKSKFVTIRPDFVFPKQRLAVFVDGCFWHGCPQHATRPKNNTAFWRTKIEGNMVRDRLQTRLLRARGWRVLRIWEHALTAKNAACTIERVRSTLFQTE